MRKYFMIIVFLLMFLSANAAYAEEGDIRVILDGEELAFDVPPQIVNGRVLVPLRRIFESMGATIDYDSEKQKIMAWKGETLLSLVIGDTSPMINGKIVPIDQPGIIINGRTLAPLRFVAESFGGSVDWDSASQTATITSPKEPVARKVTAEPPESERETPEPEPQRNYTDNQTHIDRAQDAIRWIKCRLEVDWRVRNFSTFKVILARVLVSPHDSTGFITEINYTVDLPPDFGNEISNLPFGFWVTYEPSPLRLRPFSDRMNGSFYPISIIDNGNPLFGLGSDSELLPGELFYIDLKDLYW